MSLKRELDHNKEAVTKRSKISLLENQCNPSFRDKRMTPEEKSISVNSEIKTILELYPFMCYVEGCNYKATSEEDITNHNKSVHRPKGLYECSECGQEFKKKKKLKEHSKKHTGINPFHCDDPSCFKMFPTKKAMMKHFRLTHEEPLHKCLHCEKPFRKLNELRKHVNRFHAGIVCWNPHVGTGQICREWFQTTKELTAHVKKMDPRKLAPEDSLCIACWHVYQNSLMPRHDCVDVCIQNDDYCGIFKYQDKITGGWVARVKQWATTFYLGRFKTAKEAAIAYDKQAMVLFGKGAKLNFQPGSHQSTQLKDIIQAEESTRNNTTAHRDPWNLDNVLNNLMEVEGKVTR